MARKFDHDKFVDAVRVLREQGVIGATDLKRVEPHWIRNGKRLSELVDEYDAVVSGKATVFDSSKLKEKGYRKTYETHNITSKSGKKKTLVVVPHSADETAYVENGHIVITHPAGIDRVQIPVEYHNLEQYLRDTRKHKISGQVAFRYFGGSSDVFASIDLLIDHLRHYESISDAIRAKDSKMQRELYRNLEIVRVKSSKQWFKQREQNKSKTGRRPGKVVKKSRGSKRK